MQASTRIQITLGSFLGMVLLLRWWQLPSYPAWLWLMLLNALFLSGTALLLPGTRKRAEMALCLTLSAAIALACVARITYTPGPLDIETYANGSTVSITGHIAAEPDRRPMDTRFTVRVHEIQTASGTVLSPVRGSILAVDRDGWPLHRYGDTVTVRGTLERPGPIETFRYDRYLARYGITAVVYRASIVEVREAPISVLGTLYGIKERFEARINRLYPEPHASFLAGLLTGTRRGLPPSVTEQFNTVGLTHIIAISGTNVAIVVIILGAMFFWLPMRWRFWPSVAGIVLFVLFVGASASVVRAGIMGALGLLALQTGRVADARHSLLWTACIMTAWNPAMLWDDAGFQLSLLSVAGLIELGPLLAPLCARMPSVMGLREAVQMTLAAQIATLPLVLLLFERFPVLAPIANLLAAPAIPLAMLTGCLSVLLGGIPVVGEGLILATWGSLEWILHVAAALSNLPFADVPAPRMGVMAFVGYYGLLAVALWALQRSGRIGFTIGTPAACASR